MYTICIAQAYMCVCVSYNIYVCVCIYVYIHIYIKYTYIYTYLYLKSDSKTYDQFTIEKKSKTIQCEKGRVLQKYHKGVKLDFLTHTACKTKFK